MPIRQGIRSLPLYDILATLLPGSAFLLGLIWLSGINIGDASGAFVAAFLVVGGYISGTVLRWLGREFEGTPVLFSNSRKLAAGIIDEDEIRKREPRWPGKWFSGLPIYENKATSDLSRIETTVIEESLDEITVEKFNISHSELNSGRLLQLILSHLETTPYSRAVRFQAIHSFQRNTWAAVVLLFFTSILVSANKIAWMIFNLPREFVLPGTNLPNWGVILFSLISFLIIALVFGGLKIKTNEVFIQYVFDDMYLAYYDDK